MVLANTNPIILRFYIAVLQRAWNLPRTTLKMDRHLRADQDEHAMIQYWLKELGLPHSCVGSIYKDVRTKGKPTHAGYRGVAVVIGGGSAVHRELVHLGMKYFEAVGHTGV